MKPNLLELSLPEAAAKYLSSHLLSGSLALLLGAGMSKPIGLPSWNELINRCLERLGSGPYTGDDLELGGTRVEMLCAEKRLDLRRLLRTTLYDGASIDPTSLMGNRRLGSLGALLMGSRRGTVTSVVTLNFDSVLEEYLSLHGYVSRIVTDLPALTGNENVTVYHMHGYIPSTNIEGPPPSCEIVFSKDSMNKRVGEQNGPWPTLLRTFARSKVLLLLGVGASTSIGNAVGPLLKVESEGISPTLPTAFWVGAEPLDKEVKQTLLNANVVPVKLPDHPDLDDFLLRICRGAAARIGGLSSESGLHDRTAFALY